MTRKCSLIREILEATAYVPELRTILVIGHSLDEISEGATDAVRLFWDTVRTDLSPTSMLREIEVDLPA